MASRSESLRKGFSTSACAAAAACAAIHECSTGKVTDHVEIMLYSHGPFRFDCIRHEPEPGSACYGVIKDAGDDPDVTNGLEVRVCVCQNRLGYFRIYGSSGVGIITRPGLPVPIGEPAINPGSRRLIESVLLQFCSKEGLSGGFDLTISVPEAESIAQKTMNPKLGIEGGISILGTDGFVHPYSAPAWRFSLIRSLDYAQANGWQRIGLATGKRSSLYLETICSDAFVVDTGDELAYPLEQMQRYSFKRFILGGMIGKFSKTAQGRFQTHVDQGGIDFPFLAELASEQGADKNLTEFVRNAVTAHQVQNRLAEVGIHLESELARRTAKAVFSKYNIQMEIYIFSLKGEVLGHTE